MASTGNSLRSENIRLGGMGIEKENNNPQSTSKLGSRIDLEGNIYASDEDVKERDKPPPLDSLSANVSRKGSGSGSKNPMPGPSSLITVSRTKSEREKKIGHRRVTEGGDVTYKKIETSQIMGSIQLGVQHAIGGLASKPERDLLMQDFMTVEQTIFNPGGSANTPAHRFSEFRFKTYAPIAFRYFRELFGIQPDDFLMSMCSERMRELSNPGASGSIFYLTADDEFIIKTVMYKECEFLQKLLPGYYMNLNQNPRTLLPKFFGLFCYQCNSKNIRLAVMNNLLPSSIKMHEKYDLKGSTYKRKASKSEIQKAHPTYKDLDFLSRHPEGILVEAETCDALLKTMKRDVTVLESFKIMDYSLLVGIHNLDLAAKEKAEKKAKRLQSEREADEGDGPPSSVGLSRSRSINRHRLVAHSTALESIQADSDPIDADDDVPPGGIPARNTKGERLLLFLGIIDILQSYRLKKKLEHTFKAMIHDGDTVSVHRPGFYAERFMNFMTSKVFKKIPSPLKHSPSKRRPGPSRAKAIGDQGETQAEPAYIGSPPSMSSPPVSVTAGTSKPMSPEEAKVIMPGGNNRDTAREVKRALFHSDSYTKATTEGDLVNTYSQYPVGSPPSTSSSTAAYPSVLHKERPPSMSRGKIPVGSALPPVPPRGHQSVKYDGKGFGSDSMKNYYYLQSSQNHRSKESRNSISSSTGPPSYSSVGKSQVKANGNRKNSASTVDDPNVNMSVERVVAHTSGSERTSSLRREADIGHYGTGGSGEPFIGSSETFSESRKDGSFRSSLSVASSTTTSGVSSGHGHKFHKSPPSGMYDVSRNTSATPTWTEGTPSFTESSSSGDLGCPTTPEKRFLDVEEEEEYREKREDSPEMV